MENPDQDNRQSQNSLNGFNDRINELGERTDSDFITEKIKQRPINKKKLLRRTLITAAMAVIFALVACLTFLILEPVISNWLYPEEPALIEFPAETDEMSPEDMIVDDSEMAQAEEPEEIRLQDEQITQVLDSINLSIDDYAAMYSSMAEVARNAGKSLVTVTGSVSSVDWFNDPYESKDQTSGIIIEKLNKEILLLVNYEEVIDAENIMVTFFDGSQEQAQLKKKDTNTKLAVISVESSELDSETLESITAADLSASSDSRGIVGSPVIAIGSPLGNGDSVCYGVITSNSTALNTVDSFYSLITTDIYGSDKASGVLINTKGQILGMIDNSHNGEDMKNLLSGLGITELRGVIERMSNGRDQAYLGTYGTEVSLEINDSLGVPFGAYMTGIEMDSPAMTAGIQNGDIITKIGDQEINVYKDLVNELVELEPENTVSIILMRQGPEEYVEMEFDVILGTME